MCGIFGIVLLKKEDIIQLIINGLLQLQNRGYDSAGLSIINKDKFEIYKYSSTNEVCALDKLQKLTLKLENDIYIGFGHNRWATHGIKNDINAHPHLSNESIFSIVHNGIIENYNELKQLLIKNGYYFKSQTDTEVIVNLIEFNYKQIKNVCEAIEKTIKSLRGTYGLIISSIIEPHILYCVRNGSPLLIGKNEDQIIITSEQSGFCGLVKNYITLHNDDICIIERNYLELTMKTMQHYKTKEVSYIESDLTPSPFEHWTIKEINDQPNIVLNVINNGGRIKNEYDVKLGGLEKYTHVLKTTNNIIFLGCGTSYFSGLYGMHFFKKICQFYNVMVFDGADFNENDIPLNGITTFILISQSGETKDLHRCIEIAKNKNIITIGIINVVDSLIARDVDCGIYCNAGKEVAVASTKSFTSQVICLSMAAIWFSSLYEINKYKRERFISDLHNLSNDIKLTLNNCNIKIKELSINFINTKNMFLLGKGTDEIIAKEGALKIKEITYIHSEGYSASSLKHGPFSLLDENFPVIILNLDQQYRSKILNCYQEIKSRNSPILFITNDTTIINEIDCNYILIPENKSYSSLLGIIPIQLLAYYISTDRNINPDKPKHAKSNPTK